MTNESTELVDHVVRIPRLGTKLCLVIAALLLLVAVYFAFVPLRVDVANGGVWDCGNSFSRPSPEEGGGFCGSANSIYLLRAGVFAAAAAIVGAGGFYVFGAENRIEKRVRRQIEQDL